MSKPKQTEYGKGDFNRVSEFRRLQEGYDRIDFHGTQPFYCDEGDDFWFNGEGWYFFDEVYIPIGPFNTRPVARKAREDYCKFLDEGI